MKLFNCITGAIAIFTFVTGIINFLVVDVGIGDSYFIFLTRPRIECKNLEPLQEGSGFVYNTKLFIKKPFIDYIPRYFRTSPLYEFKIESYNNTSFRDLTILNPPIPKELIAKYYSNSDSLVSLYRFKSQFIETSTLDLSLRRFINMKIEEDECLIDLNVTR